MLKLKQKYTKLKRYSRFGFKMKIKYWRHNFIFYSIENLYSIIAYQ
jgi:hypothetical protein